jgi:hypothetical protein
LFTETFTTPSTFVGGKIINRRVDNRYPVSDGIFVVLNPAENSSKLGAMIDISKGGLSFQYIDVIDSEQSYSELDIFISGVGIKIGDLPFTVISSFAFAKAIPFYSIITRRLGVKFKPLPDTKITQISSFIHNHGIHDFFPDSLA